jgi:hypothetical protein
MDAATGTIDIRESYDEDVRQRKADVMAGKNRVTKGSKGSKGVTFYSDMLRGRAKKEYTQAGDVKVSSPYQNIMPYEEWKLYDTEKKKLALGELLKFHSRNDIAAVWGRKNLDNQVYRFGFSEKLRSRGEMGAKKIKSAEYMPLSKSQVDELFAFVLRLHINEKVLSGSSVISKIKGLSKLIQPGDKYEITLIVSEVFKEHEQYGDIDV